MAQQTAVEFLVNELNFILQLDDSEWDEVYEAVEQAKAMEREQIMNAYSDGLNIDTSITPCFHPQYYYNETYGK